MLTLLFDGVAYGMLLFVLAVGLAVTLGLMNFINLAHGAFAMAGGYVTVLLMNRLGVPFLVCLPIAFVVPAILGAVLERTLYRPMYARPHLDQVLFSIGLVFMAVTGVDYFVGSMQQNIHLPDWLQGRLPIEAVGIGKYRLFIIVTCAVLTIALQWILSRTRFGSRLRASVDDPRVAGGLGLDVNRIFLATFAVGSGLAGLGGALGAEVLGLDPTFPLKFMIYFLIVVTVGGTAGLVGPFVAALVLGIADVAGKYYVPSLGAFAFDLAGRTAFAYSLVVLFVLFAVARRIVHSPFGVSLRAIRDNPLRAAAIGIPVTRRLVAIYTIAAAYAGVAGALLAQTTQYASLDVLAFDRSADVLLVLVIGGTGWLYGGLVGALVFKIAQDFFSGLTPQYWHFWVGLVLVVLVLIGRDRMRDAAKGFVARFERRTERAT